MGSSLLVIFLIIRWLRWLAIVQQKEYRADRLVTFLNSPQGKSDLLRVFPHRRDFSRTGLKRPVRTTRLLVVLMTSLGVMLLWLGCWLMIAMNWGGWFGFLITTWLGMPLVVILSIVPSVVVSQLAVSATLIQASRKVQAAHPYIIGITGSYGKTSTKLLLAHVLSKSKSVFVTPRSYNTRYSVARSILKNYRNQSLMILEYGAYRKGEIKVLAKWFGPSMGIITGLAPQHLRLFGTVENIIAAKSELLKALPTDAPVFCNAEDLGAVAICQAAQRENFIAYSGENSKIDITDMGLNDHGLLWVKWRSHLIQTQLVGQHYLSAVSAAIAVALYFQLSETQIIEAVTSFEPTDSFVNLKVGVHQSLIIDDGKATNPTGFRAALDLLSTYHARGKQTWLITAGIIDLGEKSVEIHHGLAETARKVVDRVIYLGQDGRSEFLEVFGSDFIGLDRQTDLDWTELTSSTVILIEGKVPQWVYQELGVIAK